MAIKSGMNWDGTPATWACSGSSPYYPGCTCTKYTEWPSERAGFVFGTFNKPFYKNNTFQDLFAYGNAGVGLAAGQPTQPGGWCNGTEPVGFFPCAKCNNTESNRWNNCSPCVNGDLEPTTLRSQCPVTDYTASEKSNNNILNRITLANNGLGSPTPQEGAGTEITSYTLSQFDQFGSKSNLYFEGNSQYANKANGARLRYRYVNGVLMDGTNGLPAQELWPWPMEDRIRVELARELPELGATNFSVTNTLVPLINQYTAVQVPLAILSGTPAPTPISGDLNNDGHVDYRDFISVLTQFGQNGINIFSLNTVIKNYGH